MVCLYMKAGIEAPRTRNGGDCARIISKIESDKHIDELSKVLSYNKFYDVLNFLIDKVRSSG